MTTATSTSPQADLEPGQVLTGVGFAAAAMAFQVIWLGLPAMLLSFAVVTSLFLWLFTPWQVNTGVRLWLGIGVLFFLVHVTEEFLTGLPQAGPALFGREWTDAQFLVFNAVWFVIFVGTAVWMKRPQPIHLLVALFFMVAAGLGNGVVHLGLWLYTGEYFPGGWTAPLCLLVGGALLRAIYRPPGRTAIDPGPTP